MSMFLLVACTVGAAMIGGAPARAEHQGTAHLSDPAVDAYITFVEGKQLKAPADQQFIIAALDRLVSAVEGLALGKIGPNAVVLSAARRTRHELRQLQPFAPDTPERLRNRWKVFMAAGRLVDDVARELGPRGAEKSLRNAVVRAADSIDYDDPVRWQPEALERFFSLTARALKQMAGQGGYEDS